MEFRFFLRNQNPILYQEYVVDNFQNIDNPYEIKPRKKAVGDAELLFSKLPKISSLKPNHPAKRLIVSRQIPTNFHQKLFYCRNFKEMTNTLIPNKFEDVSKDEGRIVIPIYKNGKLVGYQGRAVGKSEVRYITIVLNEEEAPMVYGYDDVEWNAKHYIFEGVFDSIFIPNSIAVCGSGLLAAAQRLNKPKQFSILVFDNEPRNVANVNSMRKAVAEGHRICIFPDTFHAKDVNEYVLSVVGQHDYVQTERVRQLGYEIKMMMDQNIYYGLKAELKIADWNRTDVNEGSKKKFSRSR